MGLTVDMEALSVACDGVVRRIRFTRPEGGNLISRQLLSDLERALADLPETLRVVVLEASESVFCLGADFDSIAASGDFAAGRHRPEVLYGLWRALACGPFISIAMVHGRANAGGIGFVAACDIAIAHPKAQFSLSEMLFGLLPASVMPFLIRRTGSHRARFMTLSTRPISAEAAERWGLIDEIADAPEAALLVHLRRFRTLQPSAIAACKRYIDGLAGDPINRDEPAALTQNRAMFSNPATLTRISRFADSGILPWGEDAR